MVAYRSAGFALALTFIAAPAWPCSVIRLVPPQELVGDADVIVVARANTLDESGTRDGTRLGPSTAVEFTVRRLLKGELLGPTLAFSGSFSTADDPNDRPVPYDFVRPGGRSGNCFAYGYRPGADYLLLLRRTGAENAAFAQAGTLTPYWSALAPTNEQLVRGDGDPWLAWVIQQLKADPGNPAHVVQTSAHEELVNKMTGRWTMTGTIGKAVTTHDVDVDWILKNEYIRIHEISRDRDPSGGVGYEAWIYVAWDPAKSEYVVMWLDNTVATNFAPEGIGHAKPDGDRIPFIYTLADGTGIHTTFTYDRAKDTWAWAIDNVDNKGASSPFARLTLVRKK